MQAISRYLELVVQEAWGSIEVELDSDVAELEAEAEEAEYVSTDTESDVSTDTIGSDIDTESDVSTDTESNVSTDTDTDTDAEVSTDTEYDHDCTVYSGPLALAPIPESVINHPESVVGHNTRANRATILSLSNNLNINWVNLVKLEEAGADRLFVCGREVFIAGFDYMYLTRDNLLLYIQKLRSRPSNDAIRRKLDRLEDML